VTGPDYPSTHYANVDLDVWSERSLQPMVEAMGSRVSVLYVGREQTRYGAHLEYRGSVFRRSACCHSRPCPCGQIASTVSAEALGHRLDS
jgi:hypothetical protein